MNIGSAAKVSGVSAKMIRHYESIGLLRPAPRRANGYRDYGVREIGELRFIRHGRALGFSTGAIGGLLALWRGGRPSKEVRALAAAHLAALDARIAELTGTARTLRRLIDACHGDSRPECAIIDELAGNRRAA